MAASSPAEIAFLAGARALYYEEMTAIIQTAVARAFGGGERDGQ